MARLLRNQIVITAACAALIGCAKPMPDPRPLPKPAQFRVTLEGPTADASLLASVSSKSGELLILEPDGSISKTKVDTPQGRMALAQDLDLMNLSDVLISDESIDVMGLPRPPSAQELAIKEFAARTQPALPRKIGPSRPEDFLDIQIHPLEHSSGQKSHRDLVEVAVNLRQGVDDSVGFAYATCALAGWADTAKVPYARHIRTLKDNGKGMLAIKSVFVTSKTEPMGLRVMETKQTLQSCKADGIPTQKTARAVKGNVKNG